MPALPTLGFDDLAALVASDPMLGQQLGQQPTNPVNEQAAAYARELAADEPAPVPAPPAQPPPQLPVSVGQSQSMSVGTEGLNQQTLADLQTGARAKGYKGDVARAKQARIKDAEFLNQNLDPAFQAQEEAARAGAAAQLSASADKAGDAEQAKGAVNAAGEALGFAPVTTTGAAQRAIAQASVVAKEQEEAAKAQMKAEGARAQYTEALNRVKSTVINPNRLVANQSLAFGLQNVVASIAAISGKPGMTNFANMLNQGMMSAMQRDVDAQMAKLQQNQSVAAGFKQVYDMVVDENDTQAQARNKMYGAYLASMEGYLESQMGQHDSEVINAQLAQSLAGIKAKRAETENKNYTDALEFGLKDAQLITSKYATDVSASVQRAQIAEARSNRIQAAKDAALKRADEQRAKLAEGTIISPFASDGGRVAGVAKDEFKGDFAKLSASVDKALGMSSDLRELAIKIEQAKDVGDTAGIAALQSEFGRRFNVVKEGLAYAVAQANQPGDPKVSDADRSAAAAMVSADPKQWILGAGAGGAIDQLERGMRENWDAAARQMMKSPDLYNETEQAYLGPRVVQHEYSDTGKAVFGAEGAAGVVEPDRYGYNPTKVGKVERDVEGSKWDKLMVPDHDTPNEKLGKQLTDVDTNGTSTLPKDKVPDWYKSYLLTDEGRYIGKYADDTVVGDKVKVPDFTQPMYNLANRAQSGDAEARKELERTADLKGDRYIEQREMANWMLGAIDNRSVNFGIEGTDYMTRLVGLSPDDQAIMAAMEQSGSRDNVFGNESLSIEDQAAATRKRFGSGHGGIK